MIGASEVTFRVNGASEVGSFGPFFGNGVANLQGGATVVPVTTGFTAQGGSVLEVAGGVVRQNDSSAWGYLASQ